LWARLAHGTRQRLAAPKVGAAQQKHVIKAALVSSGLLLVVVLKLVQAKRIHHFALPARLLEVCIAGGSMGFRVYQLLIQNIPAGCQNGAAENVELQFSCTDPGCQLRPPPDYDLFRFADHVFDLPPQGRDPVIRLLQTQLLLTFQALPHPQQNFERESKSHEG